MSSRNLLSRCIMRSSELYRSSSFNSSGRSSICDTPDDVYSDTSIEEDVLDLNNKVCGRVCYSSPSLRSDRSVFIFFAHTRVFHLRHTLLVPSCAYRTPPRRILVRAVLTISVIIIAAGNVERLLYSVSIRCDVRT